MKTVVLDRDGVINKDSDSFIKSPEEWSPIPGSLEAIARLCRADYKIVVATNQSGIARGLLDIDTLNRIHNRMLHHIRQKGGEIDAIFFCPHSADFNCECRKPKPGMFLDLATRLKINLTGVPAVGDSRRDLECAMAVNALPVLVRTGKGQRTETQIGADGSDPRFAKIPVFDNLSKFTEALLRGDLDDSIEALSQGAGLTT
ncbi:MAG: D-glycero-beta-D-manno-heptose 1,7-bisphosphate 7-phosphatase [Gammaproteobacteria bacterium]|nr:D-glycero-beta-D-manno-heptose 1,7-bisphosphate 7-phosphatase [Gammaproteobacteria bacterium]